MRRILSFQTYHYFYAKKIETTNDRIKLICFLFALYPSMCDISRESLRNEEKKFFNLQMSEIDWISNDNK
jgi:hypothetical protein